MPDGNPGTPWLVSLRPPANRRALYCFPHSGGSPGEFARWAEHLPGTDLHAIQLPGRGARVSERPFKRMAPLIAAIVGDVDFTSPFAFFGHSLGAWIAYEVTLALRAADKPQPRQLFVSECPAPDTAPLDSNWHQLPDDDLLAVLETQSGPLPEEIHDDAEFRELVLAPFRADLELAETYVPSAAEPLHCPITVVAAAAADGGLAPLKRWQDKTCSGFTVHVLPGDHFYLRANRGGLLRLITAAMSGS